MLPKHIMMREELFGTSGHCSLSMTLEVRRVGGGEVEGVGRECWRKRMR